MIMSMHSVMNFGYIIAEDNGRISKLFVDEFEIRYLFKSKAMQHKTVKLSMGIIVFQGLDEASVNVCES